jgi:DNA ligase (NAD+)
MQKLSKQEAKQRIEKLKALIDKYRYHRLVLDKPIIEESVEDSLKKELFDLEQKFPDLVTPDSPTQRVAGKPLEKFEKFQHPQPMLSFNDAFSREDMEEWEERLKRLDPRATESGYYCELKIDGLAIELVYENGVLKVGATRGNGIVGEDVTQNLKTIEAIPLSLKSEIRNPKSETSPKPQIPKELVVRGEVFLSKKEFERVPLVRFASLILK